MDEELIFDVRNCYTKLDVIEVLKQTITKCIISYYQIYLSEVTLDNIKDFITRLPKISIIKGQNKIAVFRSDEIKTSIIYSLEKILINQELNQDGHLTNKEIDDKLKKAQKLSDNKFDGVDYLIESEIQ